MPGSRADRRIDLATALAIADAELAIADAELAQLGPRLAALATEHAGAMRARFVAIAEPAGALSAELVAQLAQTRRAVVAGAPGATTWLPVLRGDELIGALGLEGWGIPSTITWRSPR